MARAVEFKLNPAGIAEIAKGSEMASLVLGAANAVAAGVPSDLNVYVEPYVSDRAGATVTISAPHAGGVEAKYGVLASAASAAGLQFRGTA